MLASLSFLLVPFLELLLVAVVLASPSMPMELVLVVVGLLVIVVSLLVIVVGLLVIVVGLLVIVVGLLVVVVELLVIVVYLFIRQHMSPWLHCQYVLLITLDNLVRISFSHYASGNDTILSHVQNCCCDHIRKTHLIYQRGRSILIRTLLRGNVIVFRCLG